MPPKGLKTSPSATKAPDDREVDAQLEQQITGYEELEPFTIEVPHFHLQARLEIGTPMRMMKLLRPRCDEEKMRALGLPESDACQSGKQTREDWHERCPHQPYVELARRASKTPNLVPILDEDGNKTGRSKIADWSEEVWFEEKPNIVQVTISKRVNSYLGLNDALAKGFRVPSTPFCEYIDCYSQDIIIETKYGKYCNEMQARYVAADARSIKLDATNAERRYDQVMGVPLR